MLLSADDFNRLYPVGTAVRYYPVTGINKSRSTRTRTPAWTLGHGEPVVSVDGVSGGVSLRNIELDDSAV